MVRLFSFFSSSTVVFSFLAIEYSVSPFWTIYVFVIIPSGGVYGIPI